MDLQSAINNINQAVRAYKGTADEHDVLKQSIQTILDALNKLQAYEAMQQQTIVQQNTENE